MTFYNEDLSTMTEVEMFLIDAPTDLLLENIRSQISNTYCSVNYTNMMSDKLNMLEEQYGDDSDIMTRVSDVRNEFFSRVITIIQEETGLYVNIDYNSSKETEEVAGEIYEFMIVDLRKNLSKFFTNFIELNKKQIVEELDIVKPKKDVVTNAVKKKLKAVDVRIVSNIYEVVDHIINLEVSSEELLTMTNGDVLLDYYNSAILSGNVTEAFIRLATDNGLINDVIPDISYSITK